MPVRPGHLKYLNIADATFHQPDTIPIIQPTVSSSDGSCYAVITPKNWLVQWVIVQKINYSFCV